jgi:uncharacterized protein
MNLPRPVPDNDSQPFWDGCREGKLLLQSCEDCGALRYPPRPMCPACNALATQWIEANGRGAIYSWIVAHHPVHPSVMDKVPYNVVLVELEEGPRIVSNLLDVDPDQIESGLPVELVMEAIDATLSLPKFKIRAD